MTDSDPADNAPTRAVRHALDVIRPAMQADGGDVEVVAVEGDTVFVRLCGMCVNCPSSSLTLRLGIERTLKEALPWVRHVERAGT